MAATTAKGAKGEAAKGGKGDGATKKEKKAKDAAGLDALLVPVSSMWGGRC